MQTSQSVAPCYRIQAAAVPRPCPSGLRACLLVWPCLEAAHGSLSAQFVRFCSRRPDGCRADGRPLPVRVTDSVISRLRPAAGRARNADVAARACLPVPRGARDCAVAERALQCPAALSGGECESFRESGPTWPFFSARSAALCCKVAAAGWSAVFLRALRNPPAGVVFSSVQSRAVRPFDAVHAPLQAQVAQINR